MTLVAKDDAGARLMEPAPAGARLIGCDVARALAMLGMILVHFAEVLAGVSWGYGPLAKFMKLLDGRPAATFVVLAGVGIALRSRRAIVSGEAEALHRVRSVIWKRGWVLLVAGFIDLAIWPGDILRVYGVAFLIAAWTFDVSDRALWALSLGFVAGFVALTLCVNYETHWDWERLDYVELWTLDGVVRNLFYDGYRSVFPWTGFLYFGIWLGRRDLRSRRVRLRWAIGGLILAGGIEVMSWLAVRYLHQAPAGFDLGAIQMLVSTVSMPPLPAFLLAAGGMAAAVIMLSIEAAECWPNHALVKALAATGQLAFTWYMAHIVLGLGTIVALGLAETQPLRVGLAAGLVFFLFTLPISVFWRRRFAHGPLEWLMRRVSGG